MKDSYNRQIDYLRLSLTPCCNHNCFYCNPNNACKASDVLSKDEIVKIIKVFATKGLSKIRITGGEPLLRSDCFEICQGLKEIAGINELCMTTNATLLRKEVALELKKAGVDRLNISLNTLNDETFKKISNRSNLESVLDGINVALDVFGNTTKLNCVLLKGINDGEINELISFAKVKNIQIRFIELMPIGLSRDIFEKYYLPANYVLSVCKDLQLKGGDGVAQIYTLASADTTVPTVGTISAISNKFCSTCNRLRLTSSGNLRLCLHSDTSISLKGLGEAEVSASIDKALALKPRSHNLGCGEYAGMAMNAIGG